MGCVETSYIHATCATALQTNYNKLRLLFCNIGPTKVMQIPRTYVLLSLRASPGEVLVVCLEEARMIMTLDQKILTSWNVTLTLILLFSICHYRSAHKYYFKVKSFCLF